MRIVDFALEEHHIRHKIVASEFCKQQSIFLIAERTGFYAMVKFIWAEKCAEFIQKSMGNSFGWCSNWYRAKVAKELKKHGTDIRIPFCSLTNRDDVKICILQAI
jgi:hypothetical protein